MVDSIDDLRGVIVGAPAQPRPAAERRRRFRSGRRRRIGVMLAGAGLAAAAAIWAWGGLAALSPETQAMAFAPLGPGAAPEPSVVRAAAPVLPPAPQPAHRLAAVAPPPVAVPGAARAPRADGIALADIIEGWALSDGNGAVRPIALAAEDWAHGPCAARNRPQGPAYCLIDRRLYARADIARETRVLLGLAHQIGAHVEAELGLALDPAKGEAQALRRDCLGGHWARQAGPVQGWLYPERVALILDPESRGGWGARRAAAFRAGYLAQRALACNRVALAG